MVMPSKTKVKGRPKGTASTTIGLPKIHRKKKKGVKRNLGNTVGTSEKVICYLINFVVKQSIYVSIQQYFYF